MIRRARYRSPATRGGAASRSCHHRIVSRGVKVTDAVERGPIELCRERADADALLLQSEPASIAHAFSFYDGQRLFVLDGAVSGDGRGYCSSGPWPAPSTISPSGARPAYQADDRTLADDGELMLAAFAAGSVDLARILR